MVARRHHQSRLRRRPALIARPCRATDRVKKSLTRGRGAASLKDSRRESSRSPFAAAGAQRTDASVLSLVQHVSRLLPAQIADEPTLCCASRGPGCASPQIVVKEAVNSLPYGSWIRTLFVGEPPALDEHINFGLAQQDQDAAQPLSPTRSAPGHPSRRCCRE